MPPNGLKQVSSSVLYSIRNCWDIAQGKLDSPNLLQPHPLEQYCLPDDLQLPQIEQVDSDAFTKLLEVYMDDFIRLACTVHVNEGISSFHLSSVAWNPHHFSASTSIDDQADKPISVKKLKQGDGCWNTQMEFLRWVFDGITKCMQLPPDKVTKI